MKNPTMLVGGMLLGSALVAAGQNEAALELRKELDALRGDYERRIDQLEVRIRELEGESAPAKVKPKRPAPEAPKAAPPLDVNQARKALNNRFRANTEIRDLAGRPDEESLLAERIEDIVEGYVDISGYFRAGYGRSDEGGRSGFREWRSTGSATRRKITASSRSRKPSIRRVCSPAARRRTVRWRG